MFQTISIWNMTRPDLEIRESVSNIKLRGYNPDPVAKVFLTGQFASQIANKEIKALSVGDIADRQCPTRRDVYYKKGTGNPRRHQGVSTWGSIAGRIAEKHVTELFTNRIDKPDARTYQGLRRLTNTHSQSFETSNKPDLAKLSRTKTRAYEDPAWLIKILKNNGRVELGLKTFQSHIFNKKKDINFGELKLNTRGALQLKPNPAQVGISVGVEPDFLIDKCKAIGDIKSGVHFEEYYLLTCAGYALAYENDKGSGHEIDWGVIYFIPTRCPTDYVKPITSAQVYLFPIDDNLRKWFLDFRNQDYSVISSSNAPGFPDPNAREHCRYCKFKQQCETEGLAL